MPCSDPEHTHTWNTEGVLVIERCEKYCGFCGHKFKHGWFTRRHVSTVHGREYPNLEVSKGWAASPSGNRKPNTSPEKRGRRYSTPSTDRSRSMSSGGMSMIGYATPDSRANDVFALANDTSITNLMGVPEDLTLDDTNFNFSMEAAEPNLNMNMIVNDNNDANLGLNSILTNTNTTLIHNPTADAEAFFVTPQRVRTTCEPIESIMPKQENYFAAHQFAEGLNDVVEHMMVGAAMTAEEITYVLETFTATFKFGLGAPVAGI